MKASAKNLIWRDEEPGTEPKDRILFWEKKNQVRVTQFRCTETLRFKSPLKRRFRV